MEQSTDYIIRGGAEGRERLRILARIMSASTASLFDRLAVREEQHCLDVGCGGGDVTLEFARRIGPRGRAIGVDIDATQLDIARHEAAAAGIRNVEYRLLDARTMDADLGPVFDIVYARFLLTHLQDPSLAVAAFYRYLRPGGLVIVEDIDFSGYFTYPESDAFQRYKDLYCTLVRRRGCDPNIGPRLPFLLTDGGFEGVNMTLIQPIGTSGEVKLLNPITLENIAGAILRDGLATRQEIDGMVDDLTRFAANPRTVAGVPRIIQAWGRRPAQLDRPHDL
ncbi:MAG TPA: methyltransferase domain-containing protein [Methylocella sp.]|nr:methyltransferase domain-containing protein [Methylocella sp.]